MLVFCCFFFFPSWSWVHVLTPMCVFCFSSSFFFVILSLWLWWSVFFLRVVWVCTYYHFKPGLANCHLLLWNWVSPLWPFLRYIVSCQIAFLTICLLTHLVGRYRNASIEYCFNYTCLVNCIIVENVNWKTSPSVNFTPLFFAKLVPTSCRYLRTLSLLAPLPVFSCVEIWD